jgi:rod shape-determining protein MreC
LIYMDSIFRRYRNITVLLGVIFAQLALLAWQVRSDSDVPLVRVWAVSAVAPVASTIESARNGATGFFSNYFTLRNAREQSRQLKTEVDKLRLENQLLRNELASAQRAEALAGFQSHTPSKMIGARVIGATPGFNSKSILIDRGSSAGVHRGMAVVTPEGIVGRVVEVFPFASQVLSVTDPGFAAGVESQKNHAHGVLKGMGNGAARVDYVSPGEKIERGEMFFTSGEDRIFPRGLPAGKVTDVTEGGSFQNVVVAPMGAESAPEEVLVILDPVHQAIPDATAADTPVFLGPDVKSDDSQPVLPAAGTSADKLLDQYKKIGAAQNHVFGEGLPGSPPPNFNLKVPGVNAPAAPPAQNTGATPAAGATSVPAAQRPAATPAAPATPTTGAPRPIATPAAPPATGTLQRPAVAPTATPNAPARTPAAPAPARGAAPLSAPAPPGVSAPAPPPAQP